jgi:hypothetical protein
MKSTIIGATKKKRRGRPPTTGIGTAINVRLPGEALDRLDAWIATQDDQPSRPEALRRLAERGLSAPVPRRRKGVLLATGKILRVKVQYEK